MIELNKKKILLTGSRGFLGKRIFSKLLERGVKEENIFCPRSATSDLRDRKACESEVRGKNVVIHAAGHVGGIGHCRTHPAESFFDNCSMALNLIDSSYRAGVEKFVGIGTVCSYPKFTEVPFKEEDLWKGYPEETNAAYGLSKKMMLVQSQAYRDQFGFNAIHLLLANLYGPGDNFDPEYSHVIPAIVRKVAEAKKERRNFIEVWGTGAASREFLHVQDAAEGILLSLERYDGREPVNIGRGEETTIKELVQAIFDLMDFKGEMRWDPSKPDGQPKRMLDTIRAEKFGFKARKPFPEGLKETVESLLSGMILK